ncbi:MAG: hypothetical protein EON94_13870 [Caulobacteraceae bacterium]|nr:MAG: hypothetical protein EON94_13870 [Caulobacteraceae bacterium]
MALGFQRRAANRLLQGALVDLVHDNAGAQVAVGQPALFVGADIFLGDDAQGVRAGPGRAALEAKGNSGPSAATSIMKNANMKVAQDRAELTLEFMGHQGLGWDGAEFTEEERTAVRSWLSGKAGSIYGGSNEVQNNIISKRILGLPDLTQSH